MTTWDDFTIFAAAASALWIAGSAVAMRSKELSKAAVWLTAGGLCVYVAFIVAFWVTLQRPPLRTLGETRLWYSLFMALSGLLTYRRWHYRWILLFSTIVSIVFVAINLLKPEIHDQSLIPALQSFWFVPHVTVYMFSYSVLGCSFLLAVAGEIQRTGQYLATADRLVYVGIAFLAFGMLSGALWAKEAWGYFWNWDPKETWAAITWSIYLLYIHLRLSGNVRHRRLLDVLLIAGFLCMQMCWYGVNYLPSAQDSMHTYGNM